MSETTDRAGKLVNGSCGEFCPDLTETIEKMWKKIVSFEDTPSDEIFSEVTDEFVKCFGDYCDLSFVRDIDVDDE